MNSLPKSNEASRNELLNLLAMNAYRHGEFTLASGRTSSHYVNCKPVSLSGVGLALISEALLEGVSHDSVAVAGLTLGADPLVSGVALLAAKNNVQLHFAQEDLVLTDNDNKDIIELYLTFGESYRKFNLFKEMYNE